MATALELTLESEQEAKFQALKSLQSKKIKYLMSSIDAKDKELAKLKILGKDNRRTQMIQALKNKLRDQELVSDVVKEELSRKGDMDQDEVNAYIMRKTLGGPKRFRPLTREELENKINDLEKKIKRNGMETASRIGVSSQQVTSSSGASIDVRSSYNNGNTTSGNVSTAAEDLSVMAKLADEVQHLRIILDSKDATIEHQKEDISRLRARNSELRVSDEELDFQDRNYRELKQAYDRMSEDLFENSQKVASCTEENILLRAEIANEVQVNQAELDGLHDQSEKLLKQNSSLLKSMATLEHDLEKALHDLTSAGALNSSASASDATKTAATIALESKVLRLTEKLKMSDEKCSEFVIENKQIDTLKDTLRDKNNNIKELKRNIEDLGKNKNQGNTISGDKTNDELRLKIVDLMEENKTLKQALAVATIGLKPSSSTDRIAK
eukprot:CAMPEP_0119044070 /NCGR_PEP_ID=MMETSP1177-20130426/28317_1 /TAXON_ID=2985 /ORGANISM="Ochromonas sp, Strain CCMP1899" /LENGTH=440 /DNA_ID=CAMNT_0007013497 /DNA_START=132 /DNA_END=1454 /DNA_ORIENTATION=-